MTGARWIAAGAAALMGVMAAPALASERQASAPQDAKSQAGKPRAARTQIIELGDVLVKELRGQNDRYAFRASAGQRVRIAVSSPDFDTVLRITHPDGFELENDDASDGTLDSMIEARMPRDGTYYLNVSSFGGDETGSYRLATMDPADPVPAQAQAASLVRGQPLEASLSSSDPARLMGQSVDYYSFSGQQGERLTLSLDSDRIDTHLTLHMPDGRTEVNDDRGGTDDTNSRLSITLPVDGTYTLAASSYAVGESGPYTVHLAAAAPGIRTVRPATGGAQVHALSVGVADYERIDPLNRTDEDALRVTAALREAGALAPGSVTLTNADATRERFRTALADLSTRTGPDDTLLIFFSGHGEKTEDAGTERDGSAETIELFDAPLFDHELAAMMEGVEARLLLVIDACFAGGFDQVIDQANNRMGIFSSDADTLSLVAQGEKSGGYISHLFRQALEGAADVNGDGAMEAGELSEYMRREFYRMVLAEPLEAEAEDFRNRMVPGFQHIIVDRGGDGMPFDQVLMNRGSATRAELAAAN